RRPTLFPYTTLFRSIRARMAKLEWLDPRQLATLIASEHAQMQAVFIAFLPPGQATDVLECLPIEQQDDLLYRIANLSEISSDVIAELEQLIERSLSVLTTQGSQVRGLKQDRKSTRLNSSHVKISY